MNERAFTDIVGNTDAPNQMKVYVDACTLFRLAAAIPADAVSGRTATQTATLLNFLEHLGSLGALVVIPESVVFETTGHRANGEQLTKQFEKDTSYLPLRAFFDAVAAGKIKNVEIVRTGKCTKRLTELEKLKASPDEFTKCKKERFFGQGDRDILALVRDNTVPGDVFVITADGDLTQKLGNITTPGGSAVGVLDSVKFCSDLHICAAPDWLSHSSGTEDIVRWMNAAITTESERRSTYGYADLAKPYNAEFIGTEETPDGGASFSRALKDLADRQERAR